MKKIMLLLSLMVTTIGTVSKADDYKFYQPTAHEMMVNLQRVIQTSKNPQEIVEAERLIREVYGPAYEKELWANVRFGLKAAGFVAGSAVFVVLLTKFISKY